MANYKFVNDKAAAEGKRGYWQSSNLKATDVGNIWDVLVRDDADAPVDCDNGVAVKVGDYSGDGIQERYGTIAKKTDKIAVTGAVTITKDAFTKAQASPLRFYNKAGQLVKTYEVVPQDVFAIASYQFTDASATEVKKNAYVIVDENGMWVAQAADPGTTVGFVGRIHSVVKDVVNEVTLVRILCEKNDQL